MKVLCLHGYAQSGPSFARKCTALTNSFANLGVETIFATAPIPVEGIDGSGALKSHRQLTTWWPVADEDPQKYRMERAIDSLKQVVATHGPFVGVLGFSQGAALAGALTGNMDKFFEGHPPLKFGIYFSGFKLSHPLYQHLFKDPTDAPTCHVVGELDHIVTFERSMSLYDVSNPVARVLIKHPGAHFVPSSPQTVEEITVFVKHSLA